MSHLGGSRWDGWIPGCPCQQCAEGLAAARARLASVADAPAPEWANEPLSLLAVAVALEHLVGPEPDPDRWPELSAWLDRYGVAGDILVQVSNGDAGLLRSLCGRQGPGGDLLSFAARRIEEAMSDE